MINSIRSSLRQLYSLALNLLRQPVYALRKCNVAWSSRIEPGAVLVNSTVGAHTYLASGVYLTVTKMGNYCSIASGTKIGGMEHSWWWGSTSPRISEQNISDKETIVEDDVWMGSNVIIRQGLHIGRGTVIGAGSVVLKDVAPYTIVAGVPAKEIRKRFPENIVREVVATKFWEYPPDKARALLNAIDFPKVV